MSEGRKQQNASTKRSSSGSASGPAGLGDVAGWQSLLIFAVLSLACLAGFVSRLFAVIRFESIIHEFDPWFNYRATAYMVRHGFYSFLNWFDDRAWYPLGRIVGGTVYPGLMLTSGALHYLLHALHIPVHIRDVCVFLAPCFSGLTALAAYSLTRQLWSVGAGLLAACFIAIAPGYISRSVAGSYDNEGIAICALLTTYACWLRALRTGSVLWAALTALAYGYMVSAWGGYVFIINLVPLHALVLILMQRFSSRLFVSYTVFFAVGLLCSMQVPFVGFQPVRTSEHMAAIGVFVLVIAYAALLFLRERLSPRLTRAHWRHLIVVALAVCAVSVLLAVVGLTQAGYVAPWSGRFYSLWDTAYAKIHIPIIASVSEHQPTTWVSFFFDLHVLACLFPAGIWFCIKRVDDLRVFLVLYAVSASYFAGVMVRLILTLTPVVCVAAAIAFSKLFDTFLRDDSRFPDADDESATSARPATRKKRIRPAESTEGAKKRKPKGERSERSDEAEESDTDNDGSREQPDEFLGINVKSIAVVVLVMTLLLFAVHCTWVTSNAYSSPSVVLASYNQDGSRNILDDFREAYFWLWQNTDENARIMSWWDYGYQIAGMGNRTTLVDNNTWNNSHIALVGKAMSSNETEAYKIMRRLDVDYVLVIFGGVIGYSGDDINKFLWMVRIAEGEHPKDIRETDYFSASGEYRIDREASETMLNSLMYKMSYWRFGELQTDFRTPAGYDRTRGAEIGRKSYSLNVLEEAFTSEHWLVRIFKVRPPPNRPRLTKLRRRLRPSLSRKSARNLLGSFKYQPSVVKGRAPKAAARTK